MSDVGCSLLGAGAWGWPREMLWGGRWEGGSCLGTHVRIKDFKIKKKLQILFHFWCLICSNYLFLLDSILLGSMFLEACPLLLGCLFLQYLLLHLLSHFLFYLSSLYFIHGQPGQRYINFLCFFKEPVLGFIDFFSPFLKNLCFIYFLSDLYCFLLLLIL